MKGQVIFMSMVIRNNMGISNGYQNNTSKTGGYKNVREYSNYLMGKYSCLKPGNNVAVSITPGLLRKAMSDEKTGQWLERELSKAPDYIKSSQQAASARGSRLVYAAIEFGEEYSTMYTCTVTDTPGRDEDIDAPIKSVGNSTTTPRDLENDEDVKIVLYILAESVAARLRENGFRCRVVEISIRDNELFSFTRQKKIDHALSAIWHQLQVFIHI